MIRKLRATPALWFGLTALTPLLAFATTVTINPTNNGYATPGNGALDGTSPLKVRNGGPEERTFLKFHLPDAGIPAGSTINSVTLKLQMTTEPNTTETYDVHNSTTGTHSADWTEASSINWFQDVPPDQLLATASAVASVPNDVIWTSTALKDATGIAILGDMTLIVTDPANGSPKEGVFEDRTEAIPPRLIIDYTAPGGGGCGAAPLTITRDDYTGPNPIPWGVTGQFTVSFTLTAGCNDVTGIKAQGGIAANQITTNWGTCPGPNPCADPRGVFVGFLTYKTPGKSNGNLVFTWTIPLLPAGTSATFSTDTYVTLNPSGNMVCDEIKSFTGGWTVSGKANGVSVHDGPTGPLEVEVSCP